MYVILGKFAELKKFQTITNFTGKLGVKNIFTLITKLIPDGIKPFFTMLMYII